MLNHFGPKILLGTKEIDFKNLPELEESFCRTLWYDFNFRPIIKPGTYSFLEKLQFLVDEQPLSQTLSTLLSPNPELAYDRVKERALKEVELTRGNK